MVKANTLRFRMLSMLTRRALIPLLIKKEDEERKIGKKRDAWGEGPASTW